MGVPAALQSTLYAVCSLAGDLDAEGTSFVCSRLPLHSFLGERERGAAGERDRQRAGAPGTTAPPAAVERLEIDTPPAALLPLPALQTRR